MNFFHFRLLFLVLSTNYSLSFNYTKRVEDIYTAFRLPVVFDENPLFFTISPRQNLTSQINSFCAYHYVSEVNCAFFQHSIEVLLKQIIEQNQAQEIKQTGVNMLPGWLICTDVYSNSKEDASLAKFKWVPTDIKEIVSFFCNFLNKNTSDYLEGDSYVDYCLTPLERVLNNSFSFLMLIHQYPSKLISEYRTPSESIKNKKFMGNSEVYSTRAPKLSLDSDCSKDVNTTGLIVKKTAVKYQSSKINYKTSSESVKKSKLARYGRNQEEKCAMEPFDYSKSMFKLNCKERDSSIESFDANTAKVLYRAIKNSRNFLRNLTVTSSSTSSEYTLLVYIFEIFLFLVNFLIYLLMSYAFWALLWLFIKYWNIKLYPLPITRVQNTCQFYEFEKITSVRKIQRSWKLYIQKRNSSAILIQQAWIFYRLIKADSAIKVQRTWIYAKKCNAAKIIQRFWRKINRNSFDRQFFHCKNIITSKCCKALELNRKRQPSSCSTIVGLVVTITERQQQKRKNAAAKLLVILTKHQKLSAWICLENGERIDLGNYKVNYRTLKKKPLNYKQNVSTSDRYNKLCKSSRKQVSLQRPKNSIQNKSPADMMNTIRFAHTYFLRNFMPGLSVLDGQIRERNAAAVVVQCAWKWHKAMRASQKINFLQALRKASNAKKVSKYMCFSDNIMDEVKDAMNKERMSSINQLKLYKISATIA